MYCNIRLIVADALRSHRSIDQSDLNGFLSLHNTSVIRQKANLKTGVSRKQSMPKFPKNKHF